MSVIGTINEAAKLIDELAQDLWEWKEAFHQHCEDEGNEVTAQLIERAYQVRKKLLGEGS